MRFLPILLLLLCTATGSSVNAQNSEFQIHANGFIYPEATMTSLGLIVDSLDLRFKSCDLDRTYKALPQTMASCYEVKDDDWRKIADLLSESEGLGKASVQKLVPAAKELRRGILYQTSGKKDEASISWNLMPLNYGSNLTVKPEGDEVMKITDLVYVASAYKSTRIWVLDGLPATGEIPEEYARLIQYVDCMVDTSQNIYREASVSATGGYLSDDETDAAGKEFLELANRYPGKKPKNIFQRKEDPTQEEYATYRSDMEAYSTSQLKWVKDQVAADSKMAKALQTIVERIEAGNTVGERAELYLEICGEYAAALESKRLRRVFGSCSQDDSPRLHAMEIARLSAASVEWSVFLRAHLNIMNDRFDRASDGSYAYGRRGTYLGELEALGINAVDLLVGSCLDAEGMAENHYESSWMRVGRALTEAKDQSEVANLLTKIIRDETLDDLNRLTGVYLLRFMASNYGKEETDKRYTRVLTEAVAGLDDEWVKLLKVE